MSTPEFILLAGMPDGESGILRAGLGRIQSQLRQHGIGYVDLAQPAEQRPEVQAAIKKQVQAIPENCRAVLVCGTEQARLPAAGLSDGDYSAIALKSLLEQLAGIIPVNKIQVVAYLLRQDLLVRNALSEAAMAGDLREAAQVVPASLQDNLSYSSMLRSIDNLKVVSKVKVRPWELAGAGPEALIQDALDNVGLAGSLDLSRLEGMHLKLRYGNRGVAVAKAMYPGMQSDRQRRKLQSFILHSLPTDADTAEEPLLPEHEAVSLLQRYAEDNRGVFRRYAADLPQATYDSATTTAAMVTEFGSRSYDPSPQPVASSSAKAQSSAARGLARGLASRLRRAAGQRKG